MGGDGSPGHAVTHLSDPKLHFKRFRKLTLWLSVHTSTAPNMCPVGCCLKWCCWSKQGAAKLFLQEKLRHPGSPQVSGTKTHSLAGSTEGAKLLLFSSLQQQVAALSRPAAGLR